MNHRNILLILSFTLMTIQFGCGSKGTTTGNPMVQLRFDQASFSLQEPKIPIPTDNLVYKVSLVERFLIENFILGKSARAQIQPLAVTQLKMCFKRLRFKTSGESTDTDPSIDSDNLDFNIGEISLTSSGSNLGSLAVPKGDYGRVEFDLESHCSSGYSLVLSNNQGTFLTQDRITIKFIGAISISEDVSLSLNVQQLISKLSTVSNSNQIRSYAESTQAEGSF